jgi:pyruvate,water dikinase
VEAIMNILEPSHYHANPQLFGGKAGALANLQTANLEIPPWFVVAPEAFYASLSPDQRGALERSEDPQDVWRIIDDIGPATEVLRALERALSTLCPNGERVAVRSSASDEDGAQHSFAGQLDSFLFVAPQEVAKKVAAVWRSGFGERVLAYRREAGLLLLPSPPAVLVQRMVDAEVSGVAFGADPVSGRRGISVVSAVYGLGTALVSGEGDADAYHVDRMGTIVRRAIADKDFAHRMCEGASEGVSGLPVAAEHRDKPALTDDQVRQVADLVRRTGEHFGRPQDIEWAIEAGRLYLLQSRPITSLAAVADPEGALGIWDNSNIVESYGGVTTPLTFTFARYAYEGVYRELCRILGFSATKLSAHENDFRHMLGLFRGRVYYNLLSWYKLLAALPGFGANRPFMEQMMGVKEGLPESVVADLAPTTWRGRLLDRLDLGVSVFKLLLNFVTLPRKVKKFYRRLDEALGDLPLPLSSMRSDELVGHYRALERKLLSSWDAPLVNDFFAMIFYGVLRRLSESWCDDPDGTLQNDLLSGEGGMVSAEPAQRVREMAALAVERAGFPELLSEGSLSEILAEMEEAPAFKESYQTYLAKFGDRCLEELKLESPTLHDDPLLLLRSVGRLARHHRVAKPASTGVDTELRRVAEARVAQTVTNPVRRLVFDWVLRQARARIRDRENLRFERTRVFGRVRRVFLELGRRLYALDVLDDPRDVFYLELQEVLGFVEGTSSSTRLADLAALRKAEFDGYRADDPPADRFETRGVVYRGNDFRAASEEPQLLEGDTLKGIGCCPGVVRGRARVVTDPRNAVLEVGDILVAERTDPGWIMLFPSAAGLLVERGSLLSHSAIVAREMGIPAIVSLQGVTRWLRDGDWLEFDGSSGVVRRLDGPPNEVAHHQEFDRAQ